jgi:hypothetical protein
MAAHVDDELVVEGPFEVDFDEAAVVVFARQFDVFTGLGNFGGAVEGNQVAFDA